MSDPLWSALVSNTAIAAAVGLVGWALSHLARRPALAHALFVLALVKLATPPIFTLGFAPEVTPPPRGQLTIATTTRAEMETRNPAPIPADEVRVAPATEPVASAAAGEPTRAVPRGWLTAVAALSLRDVAIALWCAGAALGALVVLTRSRRLSRALRAASSPDPELVRDLDAARRRVGLRHAPRTVVVAADVPPLVFAHGIRPTLVVPRALGTLDAATRTAVLTHELAHVARGDVWLRWIETAIRIALWWHPLCWWLGRELRDAEERACDAWVTADRTADERRRYGDALLHLASHARTAPPLASPAVRRPRLRPWKRRLEDVMTADRSARSPLLARVLVACVGTALLPLAFAQEPAAKPESLRDRLERIEIEFSIADAPITDWADYLAQVAGLNVVVDQAALDADPEFGTLRDLKLPKTSVRRILDVITALTDVHWTVTDGLLRLGAAAPKPPGEVSREARLDPRSIFVHGAVRAPGPMTLGQAQTVLDLVARLDVLEEADLSAVRVLRSTEDEPLSLTIDVAGILETGNSSQNVQLQPGDILSIPKRLPSDLPSLTLLPGATVRFVVDPQLSTQPGMEQLALLTQPQRVQRDGTIFVPYVGPVIVQGLTRDQVSKTVSETLDKLFTAPVQVWARLDG